MKTAPQTMERPAGRAGEMTAAVLAGPRQIRLERLACPEPGLGQVRVRLEGCGVCGSNLPVWEGRPWFEYPRPAGAPGHEGWGYVDAVGEGVRGLAVGQRVTMLSYHAFAQYDLAEAAQVVVLPPELDGTPLPGEPLGCAMNVMRRAGVTPGETVAVVGVGFLGALLVQLAARSGAHVIALARRECARAMARRMGADETVALEDHRKAAEEVQHLAGRAGCDCVIECVGLQEPLDLAGELTRERGRLLIAGYHQDGMRQVNMQMWNWKGLDVINAHERDPRLYLRGIREAVAAVATGRLTPAPLYTHAFTLGELPQAFAMMSERPEGFFKALVRMD